LRDAAVDARISLIFIDPPLAGPAGPGAPTRDPDSGYATFKGDEDGGEEETEREREGQGEGKRVPSFVYVRDVNMSRVIRWPAIKWWV